MNTPHDAAKRTGWIGIDVPNAAHVAHQLFERRIYVDHRPGCGLRVSAHFYTTDEEIERFLAAMDELVR